MVGDYLQYNGMPYRVIQVNGIVGDSFMLENGEENCGDPIPITGEILEKNGFKLHHKDRFHDADYYVYWKGGEREGTAIVVRFFEPDAGGVKVLVRFEMESFHKLGINTLHSCDIEYVHELQNAIRLYKIDKEIEL